MPLKGGRGVGVSSISSRTIIHDSDACDDDTGLRTFGSFLTIAHPCRHSNPPVMTNQEILTLDMFIHRKTYIRPLRRTLGVRERCKRPAYKRMYQFSLLVVQ